MQEEKDKIVGDKKERADHANRRALALLLEPASPTLSNTGSLRSSQIDTEWSILLYCYTEKSYNEEARTSEYEQPKHHELHTLAHTAKAMLKGCIGLLLIINGMHNSATDLRWAGCTLKHHQLENQYSGQLCDVV